MPHGPTRPRKTDTPRQAAAIIGRDIGSALRATKPAAVLALAMLTAACSVGPRNFANDNDDLRRKNLELTRRIEDQGEKIGLAEAQVQALEQQLDRPKPALPGVGYARLPRLTRIEIDRQSRAIDQDNDGVLDLVRLYVATLDQKGRFIPITGRAVVQVISIEPGKPPVVVAEKTFGPADLDGAYRQGLTGTHYTLNIPLDDPPGEMANALTTAATFTDASTGATVTRRQNLLVTQPSLGPD